MTWGSNTAAVTCEKCHGSAATAALGSFKATSGSTDPANSKVGAHVAHLASTSNLTSDIACNTCHTVPGSVNAAGHMNGTTTVNAGLNYVGGTCSTACHGSSNPSWIDTTYLTGVAANDCAKCHGYPPVGAHPSDNDCHKCHNSVAAGNTSIADVTKHLNGTTEVTADNCTDCHASLSAAHTAHTSSAFLTGKTLSAGNYGQSWFYSVSYSGGNPAYSCGYCHPNTPGTHMTGSVDLNIDPTDAAAVGTVKAKNGTPSITRTVGVSVTCSSVYCHSNGYNNSGYAYVTTPDWHGGTFSGDKCASCHGNSPSTGGKAGSSAHTAHVVGIHYQDVYSGTTGKTTGHGDPTTSTTINCNVCHSDTVAVNTNDSNTVCVTCHTGGSAKGAVAIAATSTLHINGTPDVVFGGFSVKSKAQVRDNITTVDELNTSWTRNSYKTTGSTDTSRRTPSYAGGTCSTVDCHNGNSVAWTATNISCKSCHTSLPK
jgi:predicted CxxxxCH...CXXCH cytochrome family protein